jgi:hypothetical protein
VSLREVEKRWNGIAGNLKKGAVPYDELKAYVVLCAANNAPAGLAEAVACIRDILKFEEDAAYVTDPRMKEILALAG